MQFLFQLLQTPAETAANHNPLPGWLLFGGLIIIFYFFMIRPQQKRQKEEKSFRESLAKGNKVITIGGIHGKIVSMDEHTVILQLNDENTKVKVDKVALRAHPDVEAVASNKK